MTRIQWNAVGDRKFESGLDRGVLFVDGVGVPWNGLIAVDERPDAGSLKPYYIDGRKYLQSPGVEEFAATLSAFFSPREFDACDGTEAIAPGLYATQQRRKSFGLSYRTRIGNDVDGTDYGYKIHIVYNALASTIDRSYKTLDESFNASNLSWDISTKPLLVSNTLMSAHLVLDSTELNPGVIAEVEDILYGTPTSPARMPTGQELISLIENFVNIVVEDLGNGIFTVSGPDGNVRMLTSDIFEIDSSSVTMIDTNTYTIESS